MSSSTPDYDRERRLIQKVELMIASANTDAKLSEILKKYLPPLIKKLATENEANQELVYSIGQYIERRLAISKDIKLPLKELLETFQQEENDLVVGGCITFIKSGLSRLLKHESVPMLPALLRAAMTMDKEDGDEVVRIRLRMWDVALDFLLRVLQTWEPPAPGSSADHNIQLEFSLQPIQLDFLAEELTDFISFDPKRASDFEPNSADVRAVYEKYHGQRAQTIPNVGRFLFTSLFSDRQRLRAATALSVDNLDAAASVGDRMFKQCSFDLEAAISVRFLFELYKKSSTKVRTRILSLLSRSKKSTEYDTFIWDIVQGQLSSGQSGLEATKLRVAVFSYLTWCVRVSPSIKGRRLRYINVLKEYVELQGWPEMVERTAGEIDLRAKAYESIGLLAGQPEDPSDESSPKQDYQEPPVQLANWLFSSLASDTTPNIRSSIEEALGRLSNYMGFMDADSHRKLKDVLSWHVTADLDDTDPWYSFPMKNSTRYSAVRFANKALPYADVDARYIDFLAVGSERREVAEEGNRGLHPYWHMSNQKTEIGQQQAGEITMPEFSSIVTRVFGHSGLNIAGVVYTGNVQVISTAVLICRNLLVHSALQGTLHALSVDSELQPKVEAALQHNAEARTLVKAHIQQVDTDTILLLIRACLIGLQKDDTQSAQIVFEIASLMPNNALLTVKDAVLQTASRALDSTKLQDYAARVIGICASLDETCKEVVTGGVSKATDWQAAIGSEVVKIRGHVIAAALAQSRRLLRQPLSNPGDIDENLVKLLDNIALTAGDESLKTSASLSIGQLCLCARDAMLPQLDCSGLLENLISQSKKEKETALVSLGPVLNYSLRNSNDEETLQEILDKLVPLHSVKRAEFHFALGATLAVAACGFRSLSTITLMDVDASRPEWGYNEAFLVILIKRLLEDSKTTKPSLRKATGIWLLCLIEYCGSESPVISELRACQAAFARLLNDRDDIVQETGSRGLSLVYEKGDKALRDDLVRELVQSFTGGGTKVAVSEDTELFEPGTLPTENGQSVTTYKDIVSLATEVGDPSLVYRFMNLASNNAIWNSRAAFGRFGLGSVLADNTYLTENKKFYPKLYRYRFDPNPNVQRSMDDIWKALVKDPNVVLDQNFDLIIEDLLKSVVSGKEWRAREASCAAIADLIQGRDTQKYERYLDQVWNKAFKVLDDVKGSVRVAAMKLCQTLTNMLIRSLETGDGTTKRARTMLEHAIPFLLLQMTSGAGQEVQSYAVATLLEVIKKSPPKSLRPFVPEILENLILGLSSLEHEAVNYIHLNADKYGLTANKLDQMRVSSINASPVTEAIERCLETLSTPTNADTVSGARGVTDRMMLDLPTDPVLDDAMRRLAGSFKTAIGLPSRVGLSRVMVTLVVRHQAMFRPYVDRFVQVTRKSLLDRNATISIAFSTALGYMMRLASAKEIADTSHHAQKLYFESQELSHRSVAGEIIQAISKTANDVFMNYATLFLPFAFIGHNDTEAEVRERFSPAWHDNVGGSRAIILYLQELVELTSLHIKSSLWPIKQACCLAVAEIASSLDTSDGLDLKQALLLWPLVEESLGGKTWAGKEKVITAYPNFVKHAACLWSQKEVGAQMKKIALREAKRTNATYRPPSLRALGDFAAVRSDLDMSSDVLPLLSDILDEALNDSGDKMEVDSGNGADTVVSLPTLAQAVVACMFKVLPLRDPSSTVLDQSLAIIEKCQTIQSTPVEIALSDEARSLIIRLQKEPSASIKEAMQGETASTEVEAFPNRLALGILSRKSDSDGKDRANPAQQPELLRKSRANLLEQLSQSSSTMNPSTRMQLTKAISTWMAEERSRSIKDVLERCGKNLRP